MRRVANTFHMVVPEPGSFSFMDRGYSDLEQLFGPHQFGGFFVIRAMSNLPFQRCCWQASDSANGVICDQIGTTTGFCSVKNYPASLRRIRIKDGVDMTLVFLTNITDRQARTVVELHRRRW